MIPIHYFKTLNYLVLTVNSLHEEILERLDDFIKMSLNSDNSRKPIDGSTFIYLIRVVFYKAFCLIEKPEEGEEEEGEEEGSEEQEEIDEDEDGDEDGEDE
jgi:chromatin segregation and condensation protein Rec8/ScpA/Scc1 (kleisin family)